MNLLGNEIPAALARFWANGQGPTHSNISTAFALADYEEPLADSDVTKEHRVLFALRKVDYEIARDLVEELLSLLRNAGFFDSESPQNQQLASAFSRQGAKLTKDGYLDWYGGDSDDAIPITASVLMESDLEAKPAEAQLASHSSLLLLCDTLRRLGGALRPLRQRRRGRDSLQIADEYDMQDIVEVILRSLYRDVRAEERNPSYAGSSSTIDFLIVDEKCAVEVKVTRPRRGEKQIKDEIIIDIENYQRHPLATTLIAVVYDLAGTFKNVGGFEDDLSGLRQSLDVHVIVAGVSTVSA